MAIFLFDNYFRYLLTFTALVKLFKEIAIIRIASRSQKIRKQYDIIWFKEIAIIRIAGRLATACYIWRIIAGAREDKEVLYFIFWQLNLQWQFHKVRILKSVLFSYHDNSCQVTININNLSTFRSFVPQSIPRLNVGAILLEGHQLSRMFVIERKKEKKNFKCCYLSESSL